MRSWPAPAHHHAAPGFAAAARRKRMAWLIIYSRREACLGLPAFLESAAVLYGRPFFACRPRLFAPGTVIRSRRPQCGVLGMTVMGALLVLGSAMYCRSAIELRPRLPGGIPETRSSSSCRARHDQHLFGGRGFSLMCTKASVERPCLSAVKPCPTKCVALGDAVERAPCDRSPSRSPGPVRERLQSFSAMVWHDTPNYFATCAEAPAATPAPAPAAPIRTRRNTRQSILRVPIVYANPIMRRRHRGREACGTFRRTRATTGRRPSRGSNSAELEVARR